MQNTELARKVVNHMEEKPDAFDMSDWCRCIAAHVLYQSGYTCNFRTRATFTRPDGTTFSCQESGQEARKLLGFTAADTMRLSFENPDTWARTTFRRMTEEAEQASVTS